MKDGKPFVSDLVPILGLFLARILAPIRFIYRPVLKRDITMIGLSVLAKGLVRAGTFAY